MIGSAGAIYVIGGYGGTDLKDVWVSTDGGAGRTRGGRKATRRARVRFSGGTIGVLGDSRGTLGVVPGLFGVLLGVNSVEFHSMLPALKTDSRDTQSVHQ